MLELVNRTKTIDEVVHEFIKQELETERSEYPDISPNAWDVLTNAGAFKHFYQHPQRDMVLDTWKDRGVLVIESPTEDQWKQARRLFARSKEVYQEAIIALAKLARQFKTQ